MIFADRVDAGRRLAAALGHLRGEDCVVLALPRGGVPVAAEVARALAAPLDLVIVRKLGAPHQPELAVAAVVDGDAPRLVRNEDVIHLLGVSEGYLEAEESVEVRGRRELGVSCPAQTGEDSTGLVERRASRRGDRRDRVVRGDGISIGDTVRRLGAHGDRRQ